MLTGLVEYKNLEQKIIAIQVNQQSVNDAVEFLGEIKTFREKIEKEKKDSVLELKELIKKKETPFKELLKKIDDLELMVKLKVKEFQLIENEKQKELQQEKVKQLKDEASWETAIYGEQSMPEEIILYQEKKIDENKKIVSDTAGSYIIKKWNYEIIDENRVPRCYCVSSRDKIRTAINGGCRQIDGVRIFSEDDIVIRRKANDK